MKMKLCIVWVLVSLAMHVNSKSVIETTTSERTGSQIDTVKPNQQSRRGKFFPFYTLGRFANAACTGVNSLIGTCVLNGECDDNSGLGSGSCGTTNQATCCVYQRSCGQTSSFNTTYWYNTGFPSAYAGGSRCSITVSPLSTDTCQLRVDFLDFSLAQPNGDGVCDTDYLSVSGGASRVPRICGENTGQHIYIDFDDQSDITIAVESTGSTPFNRHWHFQISQINCISRIRSPMGCLQYYTDDTGTISSFNYASSPNSGLNSIGVDGSRQIASASYGICIGMAPNQCSITYSQSGGPYSFTMTGDVGAVDPSLLGTSVVQDQNCNTDYIIIPSPSQDGALLDGGSDRFCGLGLVETTSAVKPFVVYVVADGNENMDIANRGFRLAYEQNQCPVVL